ncbi:unnamed protein product, partial [Prorocentrum cordatum]
GFTDKAACVFQAAEAELRSRVGWACKKEAPDRAASSSDVAGAPPGEAPLADGGAPAPGRLLRGTPGGGEGASCTLRRGEEARRLPWRPRSLSSDQPQEAPAARGEAAEPAPPASAPGRAGGGYFTGDDPAPEEEPFPARRLALLAFGCLALLATGHATGAVEKLDAEHIGSMVRGAGVFGCLVVAAVMSLGELVHVPAGDGWVVYGACIMIYGKAVGFLVGWFAAITSVTFSFFVVRAVGGKSFSQIKSKRIRAVLAQLDKRPPSLQPATIMQARTIPTCRRQHLKRVTYVRSLLPIRFAR